MNETRATLESLRDDLARDCVSLLNSEAFWGHIIIGIEKTVDPNIKAAASVQISTHVLLRVHPIAYFMLEERHRINILKHEILHVVLKHLLRMGQFSIRAKANVAADLAVNCLIGKDNLPPCAVFPDLFGLPDDLTLEDYYDLIPDNPSRGGGGSGGSRNGDPDDNEGANPYLPEGYDILDEHDWESAINDNALAEITVDELIRGSIRRCGDAPGYIKDLIRYKEKHKVPWRTILRRFLGSSRADLSWTKKRKSKRFGTRPGTKLNHLSTIGFGIDSSGSISNEELAAFMTELIAASKVGSDIWAAICDAKISRILHPIVPVTLIEGRGGTDFIPVFEWAESNASHLPFDGIIYLTDGYDGGKIAARGRSRLPTLWVCTFDGQWPADWGWQLRLPEHFELD